MLKHASTPEKVIKAIDDSYTKIEEELLVNATGAYEFGYPSAVSVGACALTCVVKKD
jgi:serine/threonine protein phosphatase PrpC